MAGIITPGKIISGPTKIGSYVAGGTSSYGENVTAAPLIEYRKAQRQGFKGTFKQFLSGGSITPSIDTSKIAETSQVQQLEKNTQINMAKENQTTPKLAPGLSSQNTPYAKAGSGIVQVLTPRPKRTEKGQAQAKKVIETTYDYTFGEKGKKYVGISNLSVFGVSKAEPVITLSEIKDIIESKGALPGKVISTFIPETPGEVALTGGTLKFFSVAGPKTKLLAESIFAYAGTKEAFNPEAAIESRIAGGLIATASVFGISQNKLLKEYNFPDLAELPGRIIQEIPGTKKPQQFKPSEQLQSFVEPFSRKTARLYIKTEEGKYLLGKEKSGQVISIGGGIEKGSKPETTVLLETLEELGGFKHSQLKGLKVPELKKLTKEIGIENIAYKEKLISPEETSYIFTAEIKTKDIPKLKPGSDITSLYFLKKEKAIGITGGTAQFPLKKGFFLKPGKVRASELATINFLETGQKPTWLIGAAPKIKFGDQTKTLNKLSDIFVRDKSLIAVERVQKYSVDRLFGKKPGQFKAFGDVFFIGSKSRYNVYEAVPKYAKTKSEQLFIHGTPQQALKETAFFSDTLKIDTRATRKESKLIGIYAQPPVSNVPKSPGYAGISYLGLESSASEGPIKITLKKPAAYLFKERYGKKVISTGKAITGAESEVNLPPGNILKTTGKSQPFRIGGKKVQLQPSEVVPDLIIKDYTTKLSKATTEGEKLKILDKLSKETGIPYNEPPNIRKYGLGEAAFKFLPEPILAFGGSSKIRKAKSSQPRIVPYKEKEIFKAGYSRPYKVPPRTPFIPKGSTSRYGIRYKPKYSTGYPPLTPPGPPPKIPIESPKGIVKGKLRKKSVVSFLPPAEFKPLYTPSFTSVVLNIKGPNGRKRSPYTDIFDIRPL